MQVLLSAQDISSRINIRECEILQHKCLHILQSPVVAYICLKHEAASSTLPRNSRTHQKHSPFLAFAVS